MKRILFCAAFLLAACNQKQSTEASQQPPPENGGLQNPAPPPVAAVPSMARQSTSRMGSDDAMRTGSGQTSGERESAYVAPAPQSVVSVYVDPPLEQPPPVRVAWAPPPMLVEDIPPPPSDEAVWTGGYWVWQGDWVWAHGRWAEPPRRNYHWQNPYYEHRGDSVVFVDGYWRAPERAFVAPPQNAVIALAIVAVGIIAGERPHGPGGVFVPPPPGSYRGLIVPAPLGTPPSVVTRAPPMIRQGMHITVNNNSYNNSNNTTINNTSHNTTNITNIQNITNVTLVAPAGSTATGQAVHSTISTNPHAAAGQPPVVSAMAPMPLSSHPIPAYASAHAPAALPAPQRINVQGPGIPAQHKPDTGAPSSEPTAARDKLPHATGPAHSPESAPARDQAPATAAGHAPVTAPVTHQGQARESGNQNEHNREHVSGPGATPSANRNAVAEPHGRAPEPRAPAPRPHQPEAMTAASPAGQHEMRPKMQVAALDKHPSTAVKPVHQDGKPKPANEHKPKETEQDKKND